MTEDLRQGIDDSFGKPFSRYILDDLEKVIYPLECRLYLNSIDPEYAFKDKRCLDIGCGSGRGSVLMARYGAKEVIALDWNTRNLETCDRFSHELGMEDRIKIKEGDSSNLPFDDEEFDFVWCNGVLHHTSDPGAGFREFMRVMRVDGRGWLYLYGAGGIYWQWVDFARDWIGFNSKYKADEIERILFDMQSIQAAEYMDDWFCPILERYTDREIRYCFGKAYESGVDTDTEFLLKGMTKGMPYDTSMRLFLFENKDEQRLMGEGDLRYFVFKTKSIKKSGKIVIEPSPRIVSSSAFEKLFNDVWNMKPSLNAKVNFAVKIQQELRRRLGLLKPFDETSFIVFVKEIINECR